MNSREFHYDLVVLGGGSGGLAGAFRAASHGARVALLEPGPLGGTCVNAGCVPKKAMWIAADLSAQAGLAARMGFELPETPRLDWARFVTGRQRYIEGIHDSYRHRLDKSGVALVAERGVLRAPDLVETDGGSQLRARHVLVATGSRPRALEVPGAGLAGTSDHFFGWHAPPGRVALLGGGYISVELAAVLQQLGCQVEIFARGDRLLPHADAEISALLAEDYHQMGIGLNFGYELSGIEDAGDGQVRLRDGSGALSAPFATLLSNIGRVANSAGIGLEAAGVALDGRGNVRVDRFQDTTAPGVHAVGDVTGKVTLTPVAIAAARRLMDRIFGGCEGACLDYDNIPTVVFSHPPIGAVGLTEGEARERHGDDVNVYRARFRPMRQALADRSIHSLFKVVCVGRGQRVVGIHLLGEAADEILQGFAVALKRGITLDDLQESVAIHPTSAEELVLVG